MKNLEHIERMYEPVYNLASIPTVVTSPKGYGQYLQNKKAKTKKRKNKKL